MRQLLRYINPVQPIRDAIAGMCLLLAWNNLSGSHRGERGR